MTKKVVLWDMDKGHLGVFKEKKETKKDGYFDIVFRPHGLKGLFSKKTIKNVPDYGIHKIIPPDTTEDGVPEELMIITNVGGSEMSYILDKVDENMGKNTAKAQRETARLRVREKMKEQEIIDLSRDQKEAVKRSRDIEKKERRTDEYPRVLSRRRVSDEVPLDEEERV
ncbi:hypothetical protein ACFL6S_18420 [Candidatus Poribacteria bacterium]